jgi:hypothetical protein
MDLYSKGFRPFTQDRQQEFTVCHGTRFPAACQLSIYT